MTQSRTQLDVLCVGYATHDLVAPVPSYPSPDSKVEVPDLGEQGGGPAASAAVAVARLGGRVALVTAVGDDPRGESILSGLTRERVDVSHCHRVPGASSPLSLIVVDRAAGTRTIIYHRGGARLRPEQVPPDLVARARVVLVDSLMPGAALEAARLAQQSGVPVVLDSGEMKPGVRALLASADYPVPPIRAAIDITGQSEPRLAALALLKRGVRGVVVTMGADGYVVASPDGIHREGAFEVDVVDTTGAGDAFHGGFAYGLAREWPIRRAARFAAAVAALKCRKPGGRAGLPSLAEVEAFLVERGDGPAGS